MVPLSHVAPQVRDLLDLELEAEAAKEKANEVMWAVFAAFIK